MRNRIALRRRTLVTAAFAGVAAWLGAGTGVSGAGRPRTSEHAALATLCLRLECPGRFGEVCRQALPPAERSEHRLVQVLAADLRAANGGCFPADGLARVVRQRSRDDFHAGRVAMVGGWMLSLTETRLYALAGLTPLQPGRAAAPAVRTETVA